MKPLKNALLAITGLLLLLPMSNLNAQIQKPVNWSHVLKQTEGNKAEIVFTARIEKGWHLYSQYFDEGGPVRTTFNFEKSPAYRLEGKTSEWPKPEEVYDEIFEMKIRHFSDKATFTQKVIINSQTDFKIKVEIDAQACNDADGRCVLVGEEFEIPVKGTTIFEQIKGTDTLPTLQDTSAAQSDTLSDTAAVAPEIEPIGEQNDATEKGEEQSLWVFFLIALGAGLAGALTPCVFPMIPMTVNFFLSSSGKNRAKTKIMAAIFGISIVALYVLPGALVALTGADPEFASRLSTNWLLNTIFFLMFLIFGVSFLGMFEITLPGWLSNKTDQQVDKGGYLSAFFMALTLVIVSFSCTGPIVGALLFEAAGGAVLKPILGMLGFGLSFALPFVVLAFFPSLVKKMPKSGGWLNSVKVVLGFVILALGLKFLQAVDTALQWDILSRNIVVAIWIVLSGFLGLYLLGKIKLPHDSDLPHVSVPRLFMAIAAFTFMFYLIPGLFGAPLKAIAAFLPPESTHYFNLSISGGSAHATTQQTYICHENPKYADKLSLPHGLQGYFDFEEAVSCAKEQNKPIFIDFTGHHCGNCKDMEAKVFSHPDVLQRLKNDFVVVALYVDDPTKLSDNEQYISETDGKKKDTLGKKNSDFRLANYKVISQPYYFIVDHQGKPLIDPREYNTDVNAFTDFLDKGKQVFAATYK